MSAQQNKAPVAHDGVDGDHDEPRPDGGTHAEQGDDDREQEDGRHGQAPDEEETHRCRVLGFVQQTVVPRRVLVDRRQEQPADGESGGVDGRRELVIAVLPEQRGGEGQERYQHQEEEVEIEEDAVVGSYGPEDAVVHNPEYCDRDEAQEVAEVLGLQGEQGSR